MTTDSQAEREAAHEVFERIVHPELDGRDYIFARLWFGTGYINARAAGRAGLKGALAAAFVDVMKRVCRCDAMRGVTCAPHSKYFNLEVDARALLPPPAEGPEAGEGDERG